MLLLSLSRRAAPSGGQLDVSRDGQISPRTENQTRTDTKELEPGISILSLVLISQEPKLLG